MAHLIDLFLVKHFFQAKRVQNFLRFDVCEFLNVKAREAFLPFVHVLLRLALEEASAFVRLVLHYHAVQLRGDQGAH
jgi:hypothetical protein